MSCARTGLRPVRVGLVLRPVGAPRARAAGQASRQESADRIGEFWSYPGNRTFAELLIDCEEDRTLRAVLVGMLREGDPST